MLLGSPCPLSPIRPLPLISSLLTSLPSSNFQVLVRTPEKVFENKPNLEMVLGSVTDPACVDKACKGAHGVFHLAGVVDHSRLSAPYVYRVNVEGTRNVMIAAGKHRCKVVMASTSGTVGVSARPDPVRTDADGHADVIGSWPYYDSKRKAEEVATQLSVQNGTPLVLIRPTSILGPTHPDFQTGRAMEYYRHKGIYKHLLRKVPYVPAGGLSVVDVRDLAPVFLSAMNSKEAEGKGFCLGHSNMTIASFFLKLEQVSGVPRCRVSVPYALGWGVITAIHKVTTALGKPYHVDPVVVEMANHFWYVDATEAMRVLQYNPRPLEATFHDTCQYIAQSGHRMGLPYGVPPIPPPLGQPRPPVQSKL